MFWKQRNWKLPKTPPKAEQTFAVAKSSTCEEIIICLCACIGSALGAVAGTLLCLYCFNRHYPTVFSTVGCMVGCLLFSLTVLVWDALFCPHRSHVDQA